MPYSLRSVAAAALATTFLSAVPARADHVMAGGATASASGPILTASPETAHAGSLGGALEFRFTSPDSTSDAELVALAGRPIHAHTTDGLAVTTASLAYGLTGHITLSASLPFVTRINLREGHHSHAGGVVSNTVEPLGTVSGLGDLALSAKYQFWHNHRERWGIALTGGLKLPTGATGALAPDGSLLETEHQPGTGSWDPLLGLSAYKGLGPWSVHASGSYQLSTRGAQNVRLGDHMILAAALVRDLGSARPHGADDRARAADHHHAPSWSAALETTYEYEGRQDEAGTIDVTSGSKAVWLSPGLRYASPHGWGGAVSVGLPLWQDIGLSHPDNSWRAVVQFGTRF